MSRFKKGQSGNPAGKPPGARHATTILAERLMADDAEAVVRAVIDKARDGDMQAARIVMDRIAPPRRDRTISFDLPALDTAESVAEAGRSVLKKVAGAEITPSEAADIMALFANLSRSIEVADLDRRLRALEEGSRR